MAKNREYATARINLGTLDKETQERVFKALDAAGVPFERQSGTDSDPYGFEASSVDNSKLRAEKYIELIETQFHVNTQGMNVEEADKVLREADRQAAEKLFVSDLVRRLQGGEFAASSGGVFVKWMWCKKCCDMTFPQGRLDWDSVPRMEGFTRHYQFVRDPM
jgi:hypothetical protein